MAQDDRRGAEPPTKVSDEDVTIVLIEDDRDIAEMYKLKLEMDGYRVMVSYSGEDGLERTTELLPDIVFLDIRLPKMDGLAVLQKLRADARTRNIPVVILTADDLQGLKERGIELNVREFLMKSETTPAPLSRRVEDWLAPPMELR